MMPGRRKKWSEAEERSLIDKYGEMVSDGTLGKMKTREKKFKPIALYVNSVHHARDPIAYPWQWCWKDVSTKVQNMRHQYLLVKQKVKKPQEPGSEEEEFDWVEGLAHWSNFLRYKEVFGDFSSGGSVSGGGNGDLIGFSGGGSGELGLDIVEFEENGGFGSGVLGLGFGDDEEGFVYEEVNPSGASDPSKRIKKKKKSKSEKDKMKKKKKGKNSRVGSFLLGNSNMAKRRKKRWGILGSRLREEREREEREREWEEKMERRRRVWKERMEEMMGRHRAEMAQIQTRILHEQQGLTNQLLGVVAQWAAAAHQPPVVDHAAAATNHYFSQMMQNLHHVNGLVHDDTRVDGDNQDDHFIVDAP